VREGRSAAFEALYDRHHRAILSFCRHMLGSVEEAEDAVQHTFLAAYNDLVSSPKPIQLRAWLFTIARNRCYSVLRGRREQPLEQIDEPATEGLAAQVQRRQDLRDLVGDLRRLPEDQRAALVLSEMDALSHDQIADVLGVPKDKVKALVFQARESLVASRAARETDCTEIREQLANLRGGALRRGNLRRHLRECAGCRDFRAEVDRQRRQLKVLLPVAPTLALKEAVLATTVGGTTAVGATGGGLVATSVVKGGALKGLIGVLIAGVGTAGTIVAVHDIQRGFGSAGKLVSRAPFKPAVARTTAAGTVVAVLHPLSGKGLIAIAIPDPLALRAGTGSASAPTKHVRGIPARRARRTRPHSTRGGGSDPSDGGDGSAEVGQIPVDSWSGPNPGEVGGQGVAAGGPARGADSRAESGSRGGSSRARSGGHRSGSGSGGRGSGPHAGARGSRSNGDVGNSSATHDRSAESGKSLGGAGGGPRGGAQGGSGVGGGPAATGSGGDPSQSAPSGGGSGRSGGTAYGSGSDVGQHGR
jgi:RNA polymerase sigma factor (sigma-70 family)